MWVWGYNQYLLFLVVMGPAMFFAERLLREAHWEDAAALGVVLSAGLALHILGCVILVLLLAVWFVAGFIVPADGVTRKKLLLKTALVAAIPLPRFALVAYNVSKFLEGAGKAIPQTPDDVLESQMAGQPAQVAYFGPVLVFVILCALNWRRLRWRLLALSVGLYFLMLLVPQGKELLSRLFTFVLPIRLSKALTFLVWLFGPCLFWETLGNLLGKIPPLRTRTPLRIGLTTVATLLFLAVALHLALPYKGMRWKRFEQDFKDLGIRRLHQELTNPTVGDTKRSLRLRETRAWVRLVSHFQNKDETVFFWPERGDTWTLLFGTGRMQPVPAIGKPLREEMAKPPPWSAELFAKGRIRLILCRPEDHPTSGLLRVGYRFVETWEHPTVGTYEMFVLPGSFDSLGESAP
jgi:hypothetical protein